MSDEVDEGRLDDPQALAGVDAQQMLRAIATSGAQVRAGLTAAVEAGVQELAEEGRPRAVVVTGMGGSGIAGDVLLALTAASAPVPVVVHRGPRLPGWVGAADTVVAVSCSGRTQETLAAADDAVRRGARLVAVAAGESPLARRAEQARALFVPVTPQLSPRSSLWSLATPVLVVASRLGLADLGAGDEVLEAAAARLEAVAASCRPDRDTFVNPAKTLAVELGGSLPMIWGAGAAGPVAAYRFGCQLAENAKLPAITGGLPEAHHNQVVAFAGPLAGGSAEEDLFRDRVDEEPALRLRLVVLHDDDGLEDTSSLVDASVGSAEAHGVPVTLLRSEGGSTLERLASLVGLVDFASAYLAVGHDIDPTPVQPIDDLKARAG